jgi:lipoate-protein ligase A
MKYLLNPSTDAHWNMAFDEFSLEGLNLDEPVFFLWQNAPAVIIGLNQSAHAEVNLPFLEAHGIVLARRVTGGGAVYHDLGNLNYTIVGPSRQMDDAYGIMADALRRLGVPAERSGRNDILVEGRKCSGYAKRLSKGRMMIHGTLMWDVDLETLTQALAVPGSKLEAAGVASVRSRVTNLRDYLPQFTDIKAFQAALQEMLADGDPQIPLSAQQLAAVDKMADEKFRRWEWNIGHSPSATFRSSFKFACGTVTAHYTLRRGVFSEIAFSGDFIGARPASELAERLIGRRPEELASEEVGAYFDGTSALELMRLFR